MFYRVFLAAQQENTPVYGLTRDVGQFKNEAIKTDRDYDLEVLSMHSTILGDKDMTYYSDDICRYIYKTRNNILVLTLFSELHGLSCLMDLPEAEVASAVI